MNDCKAEVGPVSLIKQAVATGSPVVAVLLVMWSQLTHDTEDLRERLRQSEAERSRMETRLREIQADVDRVERRTRPLNGRDR